MTLPQRYSSGESMSHLSNHCRSCWVDPDASPEFLGTRLMLLVKVIFVVFTAICVVLHALLFP